MAVIFLNEKVLEALKRIPMSNLAKSYSGLSRRQEAVELNKKMLEARKRTQGEEHPFTLMLMNNLARIYNDLGRTQEAVELQEKVLGVRKRDSGRGTP